MREQEYRAKDKTVKKMSRDGLVEENLSTGDAVRVSRREKDDFALSHQPDEATDFGDVLGQKREPTKTKKRRQQRYLSETDTPVQECKEEWSGEFSGEKETAVTGEIAGGTPEGGAEDARTKISEHSVREESIRGHPTSAEEFAEGDSAGRQARKKKMVQDYGRKRARKEASENFAESSPVSDADKKGSPDGKQHKKATRLFFGDEQNGMIRGVGMGIAKGVASIPVDVVTYVHDKAREAQDDNSALEGIHRAEAMTENALRLALHRSNRGLQGRNARLRREGRTAQEGNRLQFHETAKKTTARQTSEQKKNSRAVKKFWQKKRYKRAYVAAQKGEAGAGFAVGSSGAVMDKSKRMARKIIGHNKGVLITVVVIVLLLAVFALCISSCSVSIQGVAGSIIGSTYPSTDEDIYAVENAYSALEDALNEQVNRMESTHPGYDEYRYQIDEISHNPYQLISYFTAKYGEFTYEQVKDEVEEIFQEQYTLSTRATNEMVTETKTVRVGESLGQVVTTGYCNCVICCGPWAGGTTATGVYPTANHTLAVDASNPFVPIGTKVIMNGVEYVVEDTGGFGRYGVQFDVYYDNHAAASAHGRKTWEAYLADDNGRQEVEVTSTHWVSRLDVTLTNHGLDAVLRGRMDANAKGRYELYNATFGNRDYLFDTAAIPSAPSGGSGGFGYEIPSEALSDQKFANMIEEAEKYLGYPYVWGGSSPSTSFDCSGFVSWVINHCGNGWNIGRNTAEGLRGHCAYVSPEQAKPGDLVFFQGTYHTSGASHVGIYVGNNMMIHCGNPIQYTNIASSYWKKHFLAFGRIR